MATLGGFHTVQRTRLVSGMSYVYIPLVCSRGGGHKKISVQRSELKVSANLDLDENTTTDRTTPATTVTIEQGLHCHPVGIYLFPALLF